MVLEFEGNLESIHENVLTSCKAFLGKHGITDGKVNIESVGKKGDNYMAVVRRFIVENGNPDKPFQMVVKIAPTEEIPRKMTNTKESFSNESLIYNKILPKYKEMEESAEIPKSKRLRSAECYGTHLEAPYECIALEDLRLSGYTLLDRFKSLTDEEVKIMLKDLAKFHAYGFALKYRDSAMFEESKKQLFNAWGEENEMTGEFQVFLNFLSKEVESMLDKDEHKDRVKGILTTFSTAARNLYKSDLNSRHSVIVQGDCWTNNFLFKLEDGKPVEAVMLDYQLARVTSLVTDLHYFIFNCTDTETRANHYYEWLDFYYDNLTVHLSYLDLKANFVYPRDKFDADLKRYAKTSLALALILASILVRESDEVIDIKDTEVTDIKDMEKEIEQYGVSGMKTVTVKRFKDRIQGIVKDFIKFGYI